jgi:hypothetical protein
MSDTTATQDNDSPFVSIHKTELAELEQKADDLEQLTNLLLDTFDELGIACRKQQQSEAKGGQEIIEVDLPLGFRNLAINMRYKQEAVAQAEDLAEDCKDALAVTKDAANKAERQLNVERKAYIAALRALSDERDEYERRFMVLAERFFDAATMPVEETPNGE